MHDASTAKCIALYLAGVFGMERRSLVFDGHDLAETHQIDLVAFTDSGSRHQPQCHPYRYMLYPYRYAILLISTVAQCMHLIYHKLSL